MSVDNLKKAVVMVVDLKHGDTVQINGELETVSRNHLKRGFTGWTYKGDPHPNGITKVTFVVPTGKGVRYA
jgi:hypothetical protein